MDPNAAIACDCAFSAAIAALIGVVDRVEAVVVPDAFVPVFPLPDDATLVDVALELLLPDELAFALALALELPAALDDDERRLEGFATSNDDVLPDRRIVRNLSFNCTFDRSLNCGPNSLSMRINDHTLRCPLYRFTPSIKARSSAAVNGRYLR